MHDHKRKVNETYKGYTLIEKENKKDNNGRERIRRKLETDKKRKKKTMCKIKYLDRMLNTKKSKQVTHKTTEKTLEK